MEIKKVVAIVRTDALEDVEKRLRLIGVPGITIDRVKGFGEYANFFTPDWMSAHARIEIFADEGHAQEIVETIIQAGHTGTAGDGLVAILPVEQLFRIRDGRKLQSLHGPNAPPDVSEGAARVEV